MKRNALALISMALVLGCGTGTEDSPDGSSPGGDAGLAQADAGKATTVDAGLSPDAGTAGKPDTGTGSADAGSSGDPIVDAWLVAHNAVRANAQPAPNPPLNPLTWSSSAASVAATWAAKCNFAHNPGRGALGENIYASTAAATPQGAVNSWASEAKDYNYANNSCSGVCGHYTQLVWRATTAVGCAIQKCTTNSPFGGSGGGTWYIAVCDYSPPGNYVGQKPY